MRWLSRARAAVWPEPSDPAERSLLRKADWLILPYLCLVCVHLVVEVTEHPH